MILMKKVLLHQWQRILILSLLCFTVFSPLLFVSTRLRNFTPDGKQEFADDLSTFVHKYKTDTVILNAIEQEEGEELKGPKLHIYEEKDFGSAVTYSSADGNKDSEHSEITEEIIRNSEHSENTGESIHDLEKSESAENITFPLKSNGTSHELKEKDNHIQQEIVLTKTDDQWRSNQTTVHRYQNVRTPTRRDRDEKVKEMKDQLIRAKAYLSFAPPGSNSHLVKELRLRMKELERAMGEARKNSDLSRSALQKMKSMETTLSKANRVYPHCSDMVAKLRAMNYNAEEQVRAQKNQNTFLINLAARTTPKGLHCLSMQLTAKYFDLPPGKRLFPNQQRVHDPDLHHYAVFSDNILACAVVVNSTVSSAKDAESIIFHVVTDSLNLPAISMWFLLNPPSKATIQIQSIDNFGWLSTKYSSTVKQQNSHDPSYVSALNHLRFYLPDLFPLLNKIVLFDHDVVVQKDLTGLWSLDMNGKVNGAVETCQESDTSYRQMDMFINFSDPFVTKRFDANACTWAFGMNLFDLKEWRRQNLTALYHKYLQEGYKRPLWKAGSLPVGWATFYNQTVALDKRWHRLGLGYESDVGQDDINQAAVLHYDGVMKPWMDIGVGNYKTYWSKHVNYDLSYLQQCNIHS
ncbi:probable galacturonosyltransferase 6 [Ricinus communis]|uniref:Hexosyltransferase n=1 Tax=Ricinus communis TaxID=3988 RepID=B9S4T2_RICCO|nr:probable galacturonosyltransferase 6 [Ricinus communis]EEF41406.1 Glycosyltransferase QUASIMODO1, putative [Ricinus communis]|eukprot:XP_002520989.1 probable galacturonosyltransferase 6 [Ricinus communis]